MYPSNQSVTPAAMHPHKATPFISLAIAYVKKGQQAMRADVMILGRLFINVGGGFLLVLRLETRALLHILMGSLRRRKGPRQSADEVCPLVIAE